MNWLSRLFCSVLIVCYCLAFGPGVRPAVALSPVEREIKVRSNALNEELNGLADVFEAKWFACADGWTMPYRLFTPAVNPGEQYPLVLYLHGGSGTGTDNVAQYSGSHKWGTRVWARTVNQAAHPCFIAAPQWDGVAPGRAGKTKELLDDLLATLAIDTDRLYVTGFSMGGFWTWDMIEEYPGVFAAAVPCAGGGSPSKAPVIVFSEVAIWNFHGSADTTVPVHYSRDMIAALRAAGGNPRYTEYQDARHGYAALGGYTEPEIVPWLFSQSIPEPATLSFLCIGGAVLLKRSRRL